MDVIPADVLSTSSHPHRPTVVRPTTNNTNITTSISPFSFRSEFIAMVERCKQTAQLSQAQRCSQDAWAEKAWQPSDPPESIKVGVGVCRFVIPGIPTDLSSSYSRRIWPAPGAVWGRKSMGSKLMSVTTRCDTNRCRNASQASHLWLPFQ